MLSPFSSPAVVLLGLFVGLSGLTAVIALFNGTAQVRLHPVLIALGILIVLVGLSVVTSLDPLYSLFGDGDDLNGFFVYVACGLVTVLTILNCTDGKRLATLTSTVVYSGLLVACIALLQQVFAIDPYRTIAAGQVNDLGWLISQGSSTLGNPNFTGNFLVVPTVLAVFRALAPSATHRRAITDGAIAVALLMALVLTLTRGAWLSAAVGVVLWIALARARAERVPRIATAAVVVGACAVAFVLVFAGPELWRRVAELIDGGRHGLGGRTLVWGEALDIIRSRPLLGVGPAAFRLGWYTVRDISGLYVGAGAVGTDAHSSPLMLGAIAGIPALLAAAALWLGTLVAAGRRVWSASTRVSADYVAWWAAMAALGVALLTAMMTTPLLMIAFLGLGALLAPLSRSVDLPPALRLVAPVTTGVVVLACLASGLVQGSAHVSALQALSDSPAAVRAVADRPPWSGYVGTVAARLQGEAVLAAAATRSAVEIERALSDVYAPLVVRHPNDYEFPQWWAIQLFIAGDALGESTLLEEGLRVSESAIALYPNSLVLRTNRARALLDLGRVNQAAAELEGFEGADPTYGPAAEVQQAIEQATQAD
jgi:O-antigen ligase